MNYISKTIGNALEIQHLNDGVAILDADHSARPTVSLSLHPLDPRDADEISAVADAFRAHPSFCDGVRALAQVAGLRGRARLERRDQLGALVGQRSAVSSAIRAPSSGYLDA